ncbi:hypothetical protein GH714_003756 [Hevea brasiliensis]|uniref:CCHC-type domain-containing protein n=1 Tax=Hevea brasiliensis TaxID=3981 RepID=A0A6A6K5M3_HEVBR|nr:hypothetical protein GH714_003756 [Hevea brasiliensis]
MGFGYVACQGQGRGGRNFQQNHRRDDEFKLKMDVPSFSGDLDNEEMTPTKKEETLQDVSLGGTVEIAKNPASVNNKASSSNPPKTNNPYAKPILVKCYKCNEMGHRSNECPNRKSINIIEKHDDDDDKIYCGLDGEDEEEDCEQDES